MLDEESAADSLAVFRRILSPGCSYAYNQAQYMQLVTISQPRGLGSLECVYDRWAPFTRVIPIASA